MSYKHLPFVVVTVCFTLLAILALGEVCVRLFADRHVIPAPPPPKAFNPYKANDYIVNMRPYVYFHIPGSRYTQKLALFTNQYRINTMGFRGKNFTVQPAPGKKRLAVIGDSIVEGHGVRPEEVFTARLGEKIAGSGWEVINLGVQGASPLYYAANLERYLYLHPDAILLMIHENDLYEDELREKSYFHLPVLENPETLYSGGILHTWFGASRFLSFLKAAAQNLTTTPLEKIIENNARTPGIYADGKIPEKKSSFAIPSSKIDKRWEMSRQYLTYFLQTLRQRDIDLLVTSLCTVTLAFPGVRGYTTHCSNLEGRVREWTDQNDVPYISLISLMKNALQEHKRNDILIFKDYHPTPLTHSLFADELHPFIAGRLISKSEKEHNTN